MTQKLAPGFVDDVVVYFAANLPAQLNLEDTLWGDGIVLDDITQIEKMDPDIIERMMTPPYLYVFVDSAKIFDWRDGYSMLETQLVLWCVLQDTDPSTLRLKQGRYANALWKLLVAYSGAQGKYNMAAPEGDFMADFEYGMMLTKGTMAMNDVRIESRWTVTER